MMKKFSVVLLVLAAAVAAQANLVPNGDFETIYATGTTDLLVQSENCYWKSFGTDISLSGGSLTYADSGNPYSGNIDAPGWVTVQGSPDVGTAAPGIDDSSGLGVFGGWGGPTVVESAAPLTVSALSAGEVYEISAMIYGPARPIVFELLVDGVVQTPDTSEIPSASDGWVKMANTYSSISAGDVKIRMGTRDDLNDPDVWTGNRGAIDDVMFSVVPEPATMALLGLGGLALIRRRK